MISLLSIALFAISFHGCKPKLPDKKFEGHALLGCELWTSEWACVPKADRKMELVLPKSSQVLTWLAIDGDKIEPLKTVDGRVAFTLPNDDMRALTFAVGDSGAQISFAKDPRSPPVQKAEALRKQGKLDEALLLVRTATLTAKDVPYALRVRARVAYAKGGLKKSEALLEKLREVGPKRGSNYVGARLAFVHGLLQADRVDDAHIELSGLSRAAKSYPRGRFRWHLYSGRVAAGKGVLTEALRHFRTAEAGMERLRDRAGLNGARQALGLRLLDVGRYEEALQRFRLSVADAVDTCTRGRALLNLGWGHVIAQRPDARTTLERALQEIERGCRQRRLLVAVLTSLAFGELQVNNLSHAVGWLERVASTDVQAYPELGLWAWEIEAEVARRRGDLVTADRLFRAAERLADLWAIQPRLWRAQIGLAMVRIDQGDTREALAYFTRADRRLDAMAVGLSATEGRESFQVDRDWSSWTHLELLAESERWPEIIKKVERIEMRSIRHQTTTEASAGELADLSARYRRARAALRRRREGSWRQPTSVTEGAEFLELRGEVRSAVDALALAAGARSRGRLPEGTADQPLLVAHPSSDGSAAHVYLRVGPDVKRFRIGLSEAAVLEFAQTALRGSKGVLLSAVGRTKENVSLRTMLSRKLQSFLPTKIVLPVSAKERGAPPDRKLAIAVDPRGDLKAVSTMARAFANAAAGHKQVLIGSDVTRTALLAAISTSDRFVFVGHAAADEVGEGYLLLAGQERLYAGDLLGLSGAPAQVVLVGCQTSETAKRSSRFLGLAEAFVIAGARDVMATQRPISSTEALEFVEEMKRHLLRGGAEPDASMVIADFRARPVLSEFAINLGR